MDYQIRIKGHLNHLAGWVEGMSIRLEENGNTVLAGPVIDQAALYGMLKKIHDLGMPLVSVVPAEYVVNDELDSNGNNGENGKSGEESESGKNGGNGEKGEEI
jgi:hypothetical protein